ncbi:phosphatidylethanolamine N-methyltransferase isoform X2 [Xiphias gladius]|uniref:phosphatidylethanolamine N-methyltransferase isoform X2 n=1 Tax=Xiphias gladius TaxID=8245 RepID=UPI001A993D67|nr:phosphatidylethanolamine N-methyltransferase isoform X2 [Xiphias gladius]
MSDSDAAAAARSRRPAGNSRPVPLDCCGGLSNVDYSKMDLTLMEELLKHIDLHDSSFCIAVIAIIFNPLFWNVMARWEHHTRTISRLFGSPYLACYCLGFVIILLNVYRSHSMTVAMKAQARWEVMDRTDVFYTGVALMVLGTLLVVSSFLALGFTGTFLGDYFGILMDEKVTGFPFNIIENPMYWGSTANYLGLALIDWLIAPKLAGMPPRTTTIPAEIRRRARRMQKRNEVMRDESLVQSTETDGEDCVSFLSPWAT